MTRSELVTGPVAMYGLPATVHVVSTGIRPEMHVPDAHNCVSTLGAYLMPAASETVAVAIMVATVVSLWMMARNENVTAALAGTLPLHTTLLVAASYVAPPVTLSTEKLVSPGIGTLAFAVRSGAPPVFSSVTVNVRVSPGEARVWSTAIDDAAISGSGGKPGSGGAPTMVPGAMGAKST